MIHYASNGKETLENKKAAISGAGNIAQYAALKAIELGAMVVCLSDSQGAIVSTCDKGFSSEDMIMIISLKKVSLVEIMS